MPDLLFYCLLLALLYYFGYYLPQKPTNHQLELLQQENSEQIKVLEQLLQEFQELNSQL